MRPQAANRPGVPREDAFLRVAAVAMLAVLWAAVCRAVEPLPDEMIERGTRSIDLVYREDFAVALEEAKRITRRFPDHPAGYFFCAAVLDSWMAHTQSGSRENEFYQYCDLAAAKGERLLQREPDNAWARFFVGGAEGLKGQFETRYERWITAFRYGWRGVSILKELQSKCPEIADIDYGVGTYEYWRSAMTKVMFWLPGVEDQRADGIKRLFSAKQNGLFTKAPAAANLVAILWEEKRYADMLSLCEGMLQQFPTSLVFRWGKAQAEFGLGKLDEAERDFAAILREQDQVAGSNHHNSVLCHYWLARVALGKAHYTQCAAEVDLMNAYKLADDTRKRLERYFTEAASIKAEAQSPSTKGDRKGMKR